MVIPLFIIDAVKIFFIILVSNVVYLKITSYKGVTKTSKILLIMSSLCNAIVYTILNMYFIEAVAFISANMLNAVFISIILKENSSYFTLAYMLSILIAYAIYSIAVILSAFIVGIFMREKQYADLLCLVIVCGVYCLMTMLFMSLKRVKNGFNFLHKITINITYIIISFCIVALLFFGVVPKSDNNIMQRILLSLGLIVSVLLFIVIKKLITKHYKSNMRDRTIRIQKEEIDANVKAIEELKDQNLKLATTIHKYNHRLSALENSIVKVMNNSNSKFAKELSVTLNQIQKVTKQFAEETKTNIRLPSTNVVAVDNMIEYMRSEAINCGIDFSFKLCDSINPLLKEYIAEDKFETLLGDHIKDAIIAINAKQDGYKSIMILIGIVQGAYELSVYDTGVEFDISTLLKLGIEPITTHKENGGSGLGFMTTFETLKSSKASLVIEEYDANVTNYTKSVTIRFDNKNEYRIYSYRAKEIEKVCNRRDIIIKKI